MKAIGVVRKIDGLGRLVIPKELRGILDMPVGTPMEFFTTEDSIVIKKYAKGCAECGEDAPILLGKSKICPSCAEQLVNQ